ncbi:hypothetical protein [Alloalcanivorax mobilis]|uniref:hypothetical protein n=1 Tax=Alloalcanivorax mobilis TaxID=2019569 RepID=UPI000B5B364C|nr:hypothetical protein [Alloalcanivorax mobilis]ASK33313.1 hypothetical protein CEK62_02370 [Alcanivorax sp. N3-2A]|tara:strand:- start:102818 stop:103177 length:360 start_codon:yes stop_codon:yes gene_type:complete
MSALWSPWCWWRERQQRRDLARRLRAAQEEQDAGLLRNGRVDAELFVQFNGAYVYGNATPMSWLIGRLRCLYQRVRNGGELELYRPDDEPLHCRDEATLMAWIEGYFPEITVAHLNSSP